MFPDDTIAAISTPSGRSGIGIVRLSGKDAVKIADKIFVPHAKKSLRLVRSHSITYGHIMSGRREIIDEALVSVMKAPHTYTKEDIVEINCHGGPISLRGTLELILKEGARLAGPGEFTQRAFVHGRIDLTQAEAVLDIINAMTEQSRKVAVAQLSGRLSKKIGSIREELIKLTAFVEAHIDFPDEDLSSPSIKDMKTMALKIQHVLKELIESARYGLILKQGLKTAIVGRPNVGKSSLLNALLEHDRAIVTESPGTTRDIIEELLNIGGVPIRIMDTAGIRSVRNIAEKEGVKRSLQAMKDADMVLVVLDGSKALSEADRELIRQSAEQGKTGSYGKHSILVINKADLPQRIRLRLPGRQTVRISARYGTGLDELKNRIAKTAMDEQSPQTIGTEIITSVRHVQSLEKTVSSLNAFLEKISEKISPEFLAVELRESLDALGEITGAATPDEILDTIFSNFCVGK
jgi:tRNA modification GTPase